MANPKRRRVRRKAGIIVGALNYGNDRLRDRDANLPNTPEMRAVYKEISDILDNNRVAARRSLQKQIRKPNTPATNEELAIGFLVKNPEMTVAAIAKAVGVSRNTPYRWKKFIGYFETLGAIYAQNHSRPSGFRTRDDAGNFGVDGRVRSDGE